MTVQFKLLPIEQLHRGKYQPRESFDPEALKELADSIKTQGLIEPVIVRQETPNTYEIIAGERRWRAAQLVGLAEIPCLIGDYTDEQAAATTLIENIQRQDLNGLEEASGYQRLINEFHFLQDEVAILVGKSRSHIANCLRLLSLCKEVQVLIRQNTLSQGHARMLVGLPPEVQIELAEKIIQQGWSVRQIEKEVRTIKTNPNPTLAAPSSNDIQHLTNHLSEQFGAPVELSASPEQGGWLKIKFYDNDTLEGLLEKLGMSYD
ncbi:ParB/RepB/Spo0J family partition protein [Legionella impletisoli]|uniref:Probable chromosome-partitioning protein ParB n=1 Tax=Legionella impletisoli TaxID=343510 RepID=A0A917ND32_9GAMM|nr:ParB/RepB/Spo0J family partition protein [Legionella impletisoli]GGI88554.1 chromosome partitioning protein ParB [Legionella impletisoli]